eukprot:scaffold43322_cov28-Tisochrysis_lutea.AAC.9
MPSRGNSMSRIRQPSRSTKVPSSSAHTKTCDRSSRRARRERSASSFVPKEAHSNGTRRIGRPEQSGETFTPFPSPFVQAL